jgi:hypothetical protein
MFEITASKLYFTAGNTREINDLKQDLLRI